MGATTHLAYGATPMDLLHGWCAGLVKYMLAISLCILLVASGENYGQVFAVIEERMGHMPRFPESPGFSKTKFFHGVYYYYCY